MKSFGFIKLGTGLKSADDFKDAIVDKGFKIYLRRSDMDISVSDQEINLELFIVNIPELELKGEILTIENIYKKTKDKFNLDVCPLEVGLQLRIQYENQPLGEWLVIATELIRNSDGILKLFVVEYASCTISLGRNRFLPSIGIFEIPVESSFNPEAQFVFCKKVIK